ncbi:MAG: aminoacyl-histidine dipeptidase [Hydrogenoanaerobacterium sp.]
MKYVIQGYEPKVLFKYFEDLSAIPRSSGNEKAVADYLENFAKANNLFIYRDKLNDVIIKKAGSKGCENLPAVMLQGHTDMVCEKNSDTVHDFEKDGLKLVVKDGVLSADGTTLGADNGVAVALMLAVLSDDALCHPPLECVFTVQEETGLFGAVELDGSLLSAKTMINMDSEEEGIATVSCAGGMRVRLHKNREYEDEKYGFLLALSLRGLLGGHSGADIHLGRANANKLMGRILNAVLRNVQLRLVTINGGSKDNAIPRESDCVAAFKTEAERENARDIIAAVTADIKAELAAAEPNFKIDLKTEDRQAAVMSKALTEAVVRGVYLAPYGPLARNVQKGGFVVSSVNLGVITTKEDEVVLCFSLRSSEDSLQQETLHRLELLAELLGFRLSKDSEYPGWSYAEKSNIRDIFCKCYKKEFGTELKIEAIHAGLECGLFIKKMPGLDAIAVGPNLRKCHTPEEELDLASCGRFWQLLVSVLAELAK